MKISNSSTTIRTRISRAKWLCSLIITFSFASFAQNNETSFLFVGDVMQHDGQINAARNTTNDSYDYEDGWKFIRPIVNEYDIAVANLEVTLAGQPYKGYPQFSAPDELAETLVNSGFNVILTANNHSCDRGSKGVIRTLDKLDELGVPHTGTFRSQEERDANYPLMVEENGMKIAMLNYTYGTNGLEVAAPLIINYIDSTVIKEDIATAKERGADYIVCNMHWGTEYKFLPNGYQKTYEQLCYREGADMVIGGHPHVVQPIEQKKVNGEDKLTVWSLGNFVSNMQTRPTRGGLMVGGTIEKKGDAISMKEAHYYLVYVMKKSEGKVTQYYILPDFEYNKYAGNFMDGTNQSHYNNFMSDSRKLFAEHNKNATERKVSPTSETGKLYQQLLSSYYTVEIEAGDEALLHNEIIGDLLQVTVDKDGNHHMISGMCSSISDAKPVQNYINDLGIGTTSIVEVKYEMDGIHVTPATP
ncbi:MAG: CapA family protein [bacterium]|nr:CapA family protein [bacterium]